MFVWNVDYSQMINLAHVARAVKTKDPRGNPCFELIAPDGKLIGRTHDDPAIGATVWPATGAFTALRCHYAGTADEWIDEQPVLGWRVTPTGTAPVLLDDDGDLFDVLLPDGRVVCRATAQHATRDAWLEAQREDARGAARVTSITTHED